MTTNKPEVKAFLMQQDGHEPYVSLRRDSICTGTVSPLISLSDYEALQAETDVSALVEALELIEKGEDAGPDGWGAFRWADCRNIARSALADYRKGGEV